MKIIEATDRIPNLIDRLLEVWESSVRATHLFLSDGEIKSIKEYVPQALKGIAHLMIAEDDAGRPVAFMGVEDGTLEMLFISPEERGKGLGKRLIQYGIESYGVKRLAVNEQNPQAKGFYEHMGFQVYKRTDYDEQGNPYPLLYMSLAQKPWENLSSERNQMNLSLIHISNGNEGRSGGPEFPGHRPDGHSHRRRSDPRAYDGR